MASEPTRLRLRHVELAQRILAFTVEGGMRRGERLAEQQLAAYCKVSRTPVRKALRILAERGIVAADPDGGYCLALDPAGVPDLDAGLPTTAEELLYNAILRDLSAGRIGDAQTVAHLQRRYDAPRVAVQNALLRLSEDQLVERAPGQQWVFKRFAVGAEAEAASYGFRLALEPAALLADGFRPDPAAFAGLRQVMETLAGQDEGRFDQRLFERSDMDFHTMIARACGNAFMAESLTSHHRRRRSGMTPAHAQVFRLMQSNAEHLQILEQIERGQMELAADLMRVHLQMSRSQRPRLLGRGVPPPFRAVGG